MDDQDLAQRYGAPSRAGRLLLGGLAAVVGAVFLGWLAWVAWFHGTPAVSSELVGYDVVDAHTATATLEVALDEGVDATCTVRALAEDHTVVGEVSFAPADGRNDVEIRTEREATTVDKVGCTAPGQQRPR